MRSSQPNQVIFSTIQVLDAVNFFSEWSGLIIYARMYILSMQPLKNEKPSIK